VSSASAVEARQSHSRLGQCLAIWISDDTVIVIGFRVEIASLSTLTAPLFPVPPCKEKVSLLGNCEDSSGKNNTGSPQLLPDTIRLDRAIVTGEVAAAAAVIVVDDGVVVTEAPVEDDDVVVAAVDAAEFALVPVIRRRTWRLLLVIGESSRLDQLNNDIRLFDVCEPLGGLDPDCPGCPRPALLDCCTLGRSPAPADVNPFRRS
jgi:hypothetical protein